MKKVICIGNPVLHVLIKCLNHKGYDVLISRSYHDAAALLGKEGVVAVIIERDTVYGRDRAAGQAKELQKIIPTILFTTSDTAKGVKYVVSTSWPNRLNRILHYLQEIEKESVR